MHHKNWVSASVGDVCDFSSGTGFSERDWSTVGLPIIRIQNLNGSKEFNYFNGEADPRWIVEPGELLFAWAGVPGVSFGPTLWNGPRGVLNQHIYRIIPRNNIDRTWLHAALQLVTNSIEKKAHGFKSSLLHVHKKDITGHAIGVPPVGEQKAIAAVWSAWERAIEQTNLLIVEKQQFKKGITQQLLSGTRRFLPFRKSVRPLIQLGKILAKVSDSVDVDASGTYREIGIRSHGKGIFHKEPVSGASLGDKRVFNIVPGCLVLNIVFAWERALAITSDEEVGMIASHRFPMFQPDLKQVDIQYVLHYMLSDVGSNTLQLASPGGAGRNRTISQEQFLKTEIPLPPVKEQKKIVAIINTAEAELQSLRDKLHSLKKQKRGLMQQLLTGKIRVSDSLIKLGAKS